MENNLQHIFIPNEQAKELKELGFNEDGLAIWTPTSNFLLKDISQKESEFYFGGYVIPTWEQSFKFFKDKYKLDGLVLPQDRGAVIDEQPIYYIAIISYKDNVMKELFNSTSIETLLHFHPYEQARLECLKELIKIVKNDTTN